MTTDDLISNFQSMCLEQSKALRRLNSRRYNLFYDPIMAVRHELDQRGERQLIAELYHHADPHVRFQAAMATLAVFPEEARSVLQTIADREEWPSDGDARGILSALADGTFVPK